MVERVAYLGPRGTFSEQAAREYAAGGELLPYGTLRLAILALLGGEVDVTVAPIENSFEGSVTGTVDALIRHEQLKIIQELVLPVEQNLIGAGNAALNGIREVHSHPQALAQCRGWLEQNLPGADLREAPSTARAVELLSADAPQIVAIGTRIAAETYGHTVLAAAIQDSTENMTRFVALRARDAALPLPTGHDRTTLIMAVVDKPGGLVRALNVFDALEINMSKIESRPRGVSGTRAAFREAIFHIDIDGHQDDPAVKVALEAMGRKVDYLRIAGSYPRAPLPVDGKQ